MPTRHSHQPALSFVYLINHYLYIDESQAGAGVNGQIYTVTQENEQGMTRRVYIAYASCFVSSVLFFCYLAVIRMHTRVFAMFLRCLTPNRNSQSVQNISLSQSSLVAHTMVTAVGLDVIMIILSFNVDLPSM